LILLENDNCDAERQRGTESKSNVKEKHDFGEDNRISLELCHKFSWHDLSFLDKDGGEKERERESEIDGEDMTTEET